MNITKDDLESHDQPVLARKSRISYTRDFLLSVGELDFCKKLPTGFDPSIISEFEDASLDRQKTSGGLSLSSFRRNEYGSSPPSRAEGNNYPRRIHGKREIHSSGRSDKDSDSQSDRDSVDSGWRSGDQSRRSWQGPEHDGLLGSGSFPRPSGYATGFSATKVRGNDSYQLNRSNEPYHPPRPYRPASHPRRDGNDSYNDETFGSSECTSEDRVEEEKKRRDSFELMRKEQHKAFQETHKSNSMKQKDEFAIIMQLDDYKDEKVAPSTSSGLNESITLPASKSYPEKTFPSQTTVSRPLVPPGFTSTVLEKNSGSKSIIQSHLLEIGRDDAIDKCLQTKDEHLQLHNGISEDFTGKNSAELKGFSEQFYGKKSTNVFTNNTTEKIIGLFSAVDTPNKIVGIDVQSHEKSLEVFEPLENSAVPDSKVETALVDTVVGEPSKVNSSSILEKLFGSALKLDGAAADLIKHDSETDDACSSGNAQSSRFAHWFVDSADKKQEDDLSPKRSNDLLTLIVGGEKGGYDNSDVKASEQSLPPSVAFQSFECAENCITSSPKASVVANSELFYDKRKPDSVSSILTCEAVEQSLLSKVSENGSAALQPSASDQGWNHSDANMKHSSAKSDDHASQHLLSLLKKGVGPVTVGCGNDGANVGTALHIAKEENMNSTSSISDPGKTLTLETLFGSAFMEELQSVGAPVSVQRGSSGSSSKVDMTESCELPHPGMDDGLLSKNQLGMNMVNNHEHGVMGSNHRQQNQPDNIRRPWLNLNDPRAELDSSYPHVKLPKAAEIPLLEEESLIINDSMNFHNLISLGNSTKTQSLQLPQHRQDNNNNNNAAIFNPVFKDERLGMGGREREGVPFSAGLFDRRERDTEMSYRNAHVNSSSFSQIHPSEANNAKLFHHFESHPPNMNSQAEFMLPEGTVGHDPPQNQQILANMLRSPPSVGLSGFDHSIIHHPMVQQMQTSGNFPPQHMLQGLSRGAPLPVSSRHHMPPHHPHSIRGGAATPQPNNQIPGLMQELNSVHGFNIGQRLTNYSAHGVHSQGNNHPDAIQRLIQMGQTTNSKQINPISGSGHGQAHGPAGQGMYGHELNMGYGYR